MTSSRYVLSREEIQVFLPHRPPMLMVDSIHSIVTPKGEGPLKAEWVEGTEVVGERRVLEEDFFFKGHFPGHPVMPGVMQIESMAQVGCFVIYPFLGESPASFSSKNWFILNAVDSVRFRKPIRPGDLLEIKVQVKRLRGPMIFLSGSVTVDGVLSAEANLVANILSKEKLK